MPLNFSYSYTELLLDSNISNVGIFVWSAQLEDYPEDEPYDPKRIK